MTQEENQKLRTEYLNRFLDIRDMWIKYLRIHELHGKGYSSQMHSDFIQKHSQKISKLGEIRRQLNLG